MSLLLREYPGNRIRRLRMAARESGEASMCVCVCVVCIYAYMLFVCTYRVLVLVKERTRRHGGKTGGDARFSNRRSRRPGHHRLPLLLDRPSPFSRFRSGNVRRTLTLCTHE